MITPRKSALLGILVLAGLCSCRSVRTMVVANEMQGLLDLVEQEYLDEPSYTYGREAAASLLKLCDGVIAATPNNKHILGLGCRLNAQFALGFAEEEDTAYARSLYGKALEYGLRSLDSDELEEAIGKNDSAVSAVLEGCKEKHVERLFWTGLSLGGWINCSKDSVHAIADLPIAIAFMDRVIELDPTFFHGGAYLFLGQYHGSRGKGLGGDPEKAREAIERAMEIDPRVLLGKVYMARFHAIPTQNYELFERLLEEVLDAPDDILPGESLVTAIAKHQADKLLFEAEDYFVSP